jgi:hypothetical protein
VRIRLERIKASVSLVVSILCISVNQTGHIYLNVVNNNIEINLPEISKICVQNKLTVENV